MLKKFLQDESGATAIEYALIAGVMGVIVLAVFGSLQGHIQKGFDYIGKIMDGSTKPTPPTT
ncbi:Flp family type IVb pilin [Polycladidibacter stylochi]|uniref:Flp family type IVb pilin n=1 Tax=Polycladidibacter stylochi TaxID=1807766 RepID=UPI0008357D8F|nr:Flp family type IVb pilin [Pseudovibrio stylochi]